MLKYLISNTTARCYSFEGTYTCQCLAYNPDMGLTALLWQPLPQTHTCPEFYTSGTALHTRTDAHRPGSNRVSNYHLPSTTLTRALSRPRP